MSEPDCADRQLRSVQNPCLEDVLPSEESDEGATKGQDVEYRVGEDIADHLRRKPDEGTDTGGNVRRGARPWGVEEAEARLDSGKCDEDEQRQRPGKLRPVSKRRRCSDPQPCKYVNARI